MHGVSAPAGCKLFVLIAADAEVAVIIRRGPSKLFHIVRWDMEHDEFKEGSWFQGRIYEHHCCVSPDGRWLYYFAANQSRHTRESLNGNYAWSAVSEVPSLRAVWMEPQMDTYGSRCRFCRPGDWQFADAMIIPGISTDLRLVADSPYSPAQLIADCDWSGYDHESNILWTKGRHLFRRSGTGDQIVADFGATQPPAKSNS